MHTPHATLALLLAIFPTLSAAPTGAPQVAAVSASRAVSLRARPAVERTPRAEIAQALAVPLAELDTTVVLSPAKLVDGNASMDLYCAVDLVARQHARIVKSTCTGFGQAVIKTKVYAGRRYVIECAGTPGSTTWTLRLPSGSQLTASQTEHPAFLYTAEQTQDASFTFSAAANEYFIQRCEITSTKT